ncbi:MAG TPA: hypothetical protein VFD85_00595 [Gemmatimonadales bacterium]|nr:hypothetical protein [Gemmatimonadales bacterium]
MRRFPRVSQFLPAAAAAAVLAGVTCSFPTDESNQVFVTITLSSPVVVQGSQVTAHAHAFRKVGNANQEVHDVDFQWSVSNDAVAQVQRTDRGAAIITGVNAGTVHLVARAALYDKSTPVDSLIRVAKALEIDSIRPKTTLYGGRVTVYGVGINNIFIANMGNGELFPDTFSYQGVRNGLGSMEFWVPPPVTTGALLAFGPGVFATSTDTVQVGDHDIYEPNDTLPSLINLDQPGPIPQLPPLRFFNPALDFEALDRTASFGLDWYQFGQADSTQPMTFVFTGGAGADTSVFNILTDSIYYQSPNYFVGDSAWILAPTSEVIGCKGINNTYFVPFARADSFVVELGTQPTHTFSVFAEYTASGRYGMRMSRNLIRFDPSVAPDRFAPNELCNQADANFKKPAAKIQVNLGSLPFVDTTLTIDVPHATDWYRFHMPAVNGADLQDTVSVMTVSRTPLSKDTSDIDVTVIGADDFVLYGQATDSGSTEDLKVFLPTNHDYYVVVSDFAGAPVRYALCINVSTTCAALPPPITPVSGGGAAGVSPRVMKARRAIARTGATLAAQNALTRFRRLLSRRP